MKNVNGDEQGEFFDKWKSESEVNRTVRARGMKRELTLEEEKAVLAEYARLDAEYRKQQKELPIRVKAAKLCKDIVKEINDNPLALVAIMLAGEALLLKFIPRE